MYDPENDERGDMEAKQGMWGMFVMGIMSGLGLCALFVTFFTDRFVTVEGVDYVARMCFK